MSENAETELSYLVRFEGASYADAGIYAGELRNALLDASEEVEVLILRDDPKSQDFGTTLSVVLAAPAVTAIAKALGDWLKLRASASVTWSTPEGDLALKNISAKDAASIGRLLLEKDRNNL